ncbi:unnamed protein product [Paramecium pentaurelia]|uniref:Uncharacterized protein n=1 Tax=Paramecium pentaurelia TaxID=43138 RepID=A0A8S1SJ41_9CILI|nr:unnamed protein product [Paramecium pentaurelia]
MEFDFQSRPSSAFNLKGRPESAKSRLPAQLANTYGGTKKLPNVRPHSAIVTKNSKFGKKRTDEEVILEEQDYDDFDKQGIDINAILLNPPSQFGDKKLPKNIKKEKETLYEEQIELKQQINRIKEENIRLKTKNGQLQKENSKLEKLLENLDSYIQTGQGHQPLGDHILMNNLKKTLKEVKQQLTEKEAELSILKKHLKLTKVSEIEAELKNYIEESIRLRSLLDQALRNQAAQKMAVQMDNFEEKFYVQMKVINSLQQEMDQFNGLIKLKDEELFNAQVKCEQFDILKLRAEEQSEQLKQQIQEYNDKFEILQKEIQNLKTINNNLIIKATKTHNDDMHIKELEQNIIDLKINFDEKNEIIKQLEKQILEMKHYEQESFKSQEKERKQLENDMEYYKNQFELVDEKYKNLLLQVAQQDFQEEYQQQQKSDRKSARTSTVKLATMGTMSVIPSFEKDSKPPLSQIPINQPQHHNQGSQLGLIQEEKNQKQRPQSGSIKRRRTVKQEDIKDLGLELNMRFRLRKLKLEDVVENDLIDSQIKQKGKISIKDIALKLSDRPFELKDVEKMYLLARYMIEDNTQDWVDYDEEATCQLQIVRSIFKQIVGKCKIFTEDEERQYSNEISAQIMKFKKSILSYLPTFNQPQLTKDQLTKAFNYIGIHLSNEAFDYFFLRLFELQGESDVRKFDYKLVIEEWGKEEKEQIKKQKQQDRRDTKLNTNFAYGQKFSIEK